MTDRLRKTEWEVRDIPFGTARALVVANHYSRGTSNTGVYFHGLFRVGDPECQGAAWWLPPIVAAARAIAGPDWKGVLALSRLVVLPAVPKNACSFLISRSQRLIDRQRWPVLVTYADQWRGHSGAIYRACNWRYEGLGKPEAIYTLNGKMVARKAGPKSRSHEEMLALGCQFEGRFRKHRFTHRMNSERGR